LVLWVPLIGGMLLAAVVISRRAETATRAAATATLAAPSSAAPEAIDGAPAAPPGPPMAGASSDGTGGDVRPTVPGSVTVVGGAAPAVGGGEASAPPPELEGGLRPPLTPRGPPGRLSSEAVRDTVREAMPFLRFCFEWQLDRHPELAGRVSMDWRILPDGTVADAGIAEDALHDETVLRCFRGVIGRLQFPPPEGGGEVTVRYPFVLSGAPDAERPEGI
jgi:hypothetical protein